LQEELASTENKIGFARQFYNDQVMKYNTKIQSIPTNIIAGIFNFSAQAFFELENKAEREVPKVQF
jgi:LemA protein